MKKRYMNNKLFYIPQRKRDQRGGGFGSIAKALGKIAIKGIGTAVKSIPKSIVKPILKSSFVQKLAARSAARAAATAAKGAASNVAKTAKASSHQGIQRALLGL